MENELVNWLPWTFSPICCIKKKKLKNINVQRLDCLLGVTDGAWKTLFGELESWGWPAQVCTDALPTAIQGHFSPESYQGCCWEICAPPFHVPPPTLSDKCLTDLSAKELVLSPEALFLCLTSKEKQMSIFCFSFFLRLPGHSETKIMILLYQWCSKLWFNYLCSITSILSILNVFSAWDLPVCLFFHSLTEYHKQIRLYISPCPWEFIQCILTLFAFCFLCPGQIRCLFWSSRWLIQHWLPRVHRNHFWHLQKGKVWCTKPLVLIRKWMRSMELWGLNRFTARSHCPAYSVQKIHKTAKDSHKMRVEKETISLFQLHLSLTKKLRFKIDKDTQWRPPQTSPTCLHQFLL